MESGKLRHVIDIQEKSNVPDGAGGITESWTDLYTGVRASINTKVSSESTDLSQTESIATHEIKFRYCPDINSTMRINFNGRIFNIISVINKQERNRQIIILAKEKT